MFLLSDENCACLSFTCCHCGESYGPRILPSHDMLSPCHVINDASFGVENIRFNRGTRGKCLNTFAGTLDKPTRLYLPASHTGHVSSSAYSRLNNTHPFLHASMASYLSPSLLTIVVAVPSLVGNEFGKGRMTFEKRCSSSEMHAFDTLCVRQTFMNNNVLSSLDKFEPQNRGVLHSSFRAEAPSNAKRPSSPSASKLPSRSTGSSLSSSSSWLSLIESDELPSSLPASLPAPLPALPSQTEACQRNLSSGIAHCTLTTLGRESLLHACN